jgi:hypothetical protein
MKEENMAKQDFLDNFRVARNLFVHPVAQAESSRIDPQALERRPVRSAIWLTPKSVMGFSPDDFAELGPARQRELSEPIREFLSVAQKVPPTVMKAALVRRQLTPGLISS